MEPTEGWTPTGLRGPILGATIWEFLYFWPIWVIGPWWTILLVHSLTGGHDDEDDTEPGPHGLPGR